MKDLNATHDETVRRQRWMIVDDNPQVLDLLRQSAGYFTDREIECYANPRVALEAFQSAPGEFEFVITDLDMPGMDGFELCDRIHKTAPALKVLLATGSWDAQDEELARKGFCGWVRKPFPLAELASALAAAGLGKLGLTLATLMAA